MGSRGFSFGELHERLPKFRDEFKCMTLGNLYDRALCQHRASDPGIVPHARMPSPNLIARVNLLTRIRLAYDRLTPEVNYLKNYPTLRYTTVLAHHKRIPIPA